VRRDPDAPPCQYNDVARAIRKDCKVVRKELVDVKSNQTEACPKLIELLKCVKENLKCAGFAKYLKSDSSEVSKLLQDFNITQCKPKTASISISAGTKTMLEKAKNAFLSLKSKTPSVEAAKNKTQHVLSNLLGRLQNKLGKGSADTFKPVKTSIFQKLGSVMLKLGKKSKDSTTDVKDLAKEAVEEADKEEEIEVQQEAGKDEGEATPARVDQRRILDGLGDQVSQAAGDVVGHVKTKISSAIGNIAGREETRQMGADEAK